MAKEEASQAIYQFHILLLKISPAIWRRVLAPSDQSLADFHDTLQIAMGWDDTHLHRFLIRGKAYGITRDGGLGFRDDPKQIRLSDLHLRIKERFLYEYDFHAFWQHQIRLERTLPLDPTQTYPRCIGGARKAPPQWCNGTLAYLEQKQYFPSGILVVVFSKSLRMKKRVWVITRRKRLPCSTGCKRRPLIVQQRIAVSPSSLQVRSVGKRRRK